MNAVARRLQNTKGRKSNLPESGHHLAFSTEYFIDQYPLLARGHLITFEH